MDTAVKRTVLPPGGRAKTRKPRLLPDRLAGRLSDLLAACASVLAVIFLVSCFRATGPNFTAGIAGILSISLSRSVEELAGWIRKKPGQGPQAIHDIDEKRS